MQKFRNILKTKAPKLKGDAGYVIIMLLALACTMLVSEPAQADINNCTITLSPSGQSYGELLKSRQTFVSTAQGNATALTPRSSNLTIICPQAEKMHLRFTGNRLNDGDFSFGQKGKVSAILSSAVLDGNAVQLTKTKHKGVAIAPAIADSQTLSSDDEITIGDTSSLQGTNLNAVLTITPYLMESAFVVPDAYVQEELLNIELVPVN
ncbi:hypothetical protein ACT3RR_03790 [Ewingella sp. AOP8-B2-18]